MNQENKKRINKLIIPFTRRTLSFLTATTMLVTGTTGCKENDNDKDTSSLTTSISDTDIISSSEELIIEDNIDSSINEESDIGQSNNNEVSNNTTSSNNSSKNEQSNITNSNQNHSSSVTTPSENVPSVSTPVEIPSTPSEPTMPSTLTAENINDVEVFKKFANEFQSSISPGAVNTTFHYTYNGVKYTTNGDNEFRLSLMLLNKSYVDDNLISSIFSTYSEDEFKKQASFIEQIISIVYTDGVIYDFSNLCVDKNLGKFLDDFTLEYMKVYNGGNSQKFEEILTGYFKNKNSIYYYGSGNSWVDYYVWSLASFSIFYINDIDLGMAIQDCNGYLDYMNYVNQSYREIKDKTKVYVKQ